MDIDLFLLPHQAEFIQDTTTRNLALVGGYGCGKTHAAAAKLLVLALMNAGHELIALSPTYGMADKVLIPAIEAILDENNFSYTFNKSKLIFDISINGRKTLIHVMAAETYKRAAGINAAAFLVDELDLIDPDTARAAWSMLSSRLRSGKVFQACATTTPEGYQFAWQYFVDEPLQKPQIQDKPTTSRRIIKARTYDNPHLPEGYIESLRAQYPPELIEAYLNGEFVNMNGRVVYDQYGYQLGKNNTPLTLAQIQPHERIHIGMDFNVRGMSAVAAVIRDGEAYVFDELLGAFNVMDLAAQINRRYAGYDMLIYPDASGSAGNAASDHSCHALLEQAGLELRKLSKNPPVRDRVNSVNALFLNGQKERRLHINKDSCPGLHKALMAQTWDKSGAPAKGAVIGLPSTKDTMIDGPLDALGYFVYKNWPVKMGNPTYQMKLVA